MQTISQGELEARYPTPLIRGRRVSRIGENYLGYSRADADTCRTLGEEQVGWFIGGISTFDRMVDHIRQVNAAVAGGRWVVIPATRSLAEVAYEQWFEESLSVGPSSRATMWHDNLVTFCVPERLAEAMAFLGEQEVGVAGILLLDPNCIVHRGRSFSRRGVRIAHDRPQKVVNFRASQAIGRWAPPLIVMSRHRAAAVSTQDVARVFCLESLQFIEGVSLRSGRIRAVPQISGDEAGHKEPAAVSAA